MAGMDSRKDLLKIRLENQGSQVEVGRVSPAGDQLVEIALAVLEEHEDSVHSRHLHDQLYQVRMLELVEFIQCRNFPQQMRWDAIVSFFFEVGDLESVDLARLAVDAFEDLGVGTLPEIVVLENRNLRKHNILLVLMLVMTDRIVRVHFE